jgi:biofilm PGA synthesis N-glycosyltransferase PgaC
MTVEIRPKQKQFERSDDGLRYAVITPVRDEAEYIQKTLDAMTGQSIKPVEWIIVDDGSIDATPEIVSRYAAVTPWIRQVRRADRGSRQRGKGVVEAFYAGFENLDEDFDFIVKLDGDLSFAAEYFESLLREFGANPKLGIAGGGVYEKLDGENWVLRASRDHVRGPTKVYRRSCFEAIGGLVPALGWDGIDEWQARAQGWDVRTFAELKVYHYRVTGAATGTLRSRIEEGYGAHFMGYHPLYQIARGIQHMPSKPFVVGGAAMIVAFFIAWLRGERQIADRQVIRYVRRTQLEQLAGLLTGKPIHEYDR